MDKQKDHRKCNRCGIDVSKRPLMRINCMGIPGIFWCELCVKEQEPELYNNLKEDESDAEQTLKQIFYHD